MGARLVRIRRVAELLRPYRLRAGAATAAITLATLATLAPPYLAGQGDRRCDQRGEHGAARRDRACHGRRARAGLARALRPDLPHRVGRPARAAGPAHPPLRPCPDALDQLLQPSQRRDLDIAPDQQRRDARPARHRRSQRARHERRHDRRRGRRPLRARPRARAGHDRRDPAARGGNVDLLPAIRAHLHRGARLDRHRHRESGGVAVGCPRRARLRPGAAP